MSVRLNKAVFSSDKNNRGQLILASSGGKAISSPSRGYTKSTPSGGGSFNQNCFKTMVETPQHTYQILTKRSERLVELAPHLPWSTNIWMGVSVEDARVIHRIDDLRQVPAHVRFLSLEPLLGALDDLNLDGIHWAIVGGESGPGCMPMMPEWVDSILTQCRAAGVAFFFKQWGGPGRDKGGRLLHGQLYDEYPN